MAGEWHPDPTGRHEYRWWDGQQWTDQVADYGVCGCRPKDGSGAVRPSPSRPPTRSSTPWLGGRGTGRRRGNCGRVRRGARQVRRGRPGRRRGSAWPAGIPLTNPWARLGAWLLDLLLIIVTLFIGWAVWTLIIWSTGETPGKQICGQRVAMKQTWSGGQGGARWRCRDFVIRGLAIGILGQLTCGIVSLVATLMIFSAYHETLVGQVGRHARRGRRAGRTLAVG